ncbi:MAG TPA: tRNA epoxyqueuosine(34) reductase QueG [Petrimonas sp.]|uniref:tRNA epoxyqueuosine(34) reductase QueG n=1 Tax=Petrimonas sp. TaxID=2023866 RepID=UPI001761CD67|nr:tRNA epoxyqueuosine(34) reductase QueG [Petrimonas sp.]MEA4978541.1 tRNA epoxyqueuosine(34) reductase QueG [Petrimonas sp.]MEA5061764.1 tRNA epoxyqueuosine(34) reductase QueG [Petrimonas sp.]HHV85828.1 tRNA epoxyqueuosine(34) reductase QueG [Petrimonas sp.]
MTFSEEIKQYALSLGFDACGICRAEESEQEANYMRWLSEECHAGMSYLERNVDKRMDPGLLVEGARSIISVALNYFPHRFQHENAPKFAYYAYGEDYHDIVKGKLSRLFDFIKLRFPDVSGRYFSDSAPVLERFWAARAGLGFVGKNTLLIIPGKGSYFFLGELIIDLELDYDSPVSQNCGRCRRCLDACPTGAIEKPHWLNARKCISYQTIEKKGNISPEIIPRLSNNVYGCDICQIVCPWNRYARPHNTPGFNPSDEFLSLDYEGLQEMDEDTYRRIFRKSAVKRAKFAGLKRNATAWKSSQQTGGEIS